VTADATPRDPSLPEEVARCLAPTTFLDSDHPAVQRFAAEAVADATDVRERAVRLFLAVRDGVRYDPYAAAFSPDGYVASRVTAMEATFCVPKAVLLTAAARAAGIPARLGFADVRNHLTSEKLRALMGTDVFAWHGYSELWVQGRWVKVSSAFNRELCERFGTKVLDWDGEHDALMHPFDESGRRHMEYVAQHGSFDDLPYDRLIAEYRRIYGDFFRKLGEPSLQADEAFER
jgi:transglutaminase-like putative cysteine protease